MAPGEVNIEVMVGLASRQIWRRVLVVPQGCTVHQALLLAGVGEQVGVPSLQEAWRLGWSVGVWAKKAAPEQMLREGDRVELVRPLTVDPKEARRVRYRAQGEKLPKGYHPPKSRNPGGA